MISVLWVQKEGTIELKD